MATVAKFTSYAFRDREPTADEMERLRLVLSVFQDGSGNVRMPDGSTRADWRQVERAIAEVFGGETAENKGIFDIAIDADGAKPYGLSVKTSKRRPDDRVLMELANSPAKFMAAALAQGLVWAAETVELGECAVRTIEGWHHVVEDLVDVERSAYVVLTHDQQKIDFELFWFPLRLPQPGELAWEIRGAAIVGRDDSGDALIEFYPFSGGQVKFYPRGDDATWRSGHFQLEEAQPSTLLKRAEGYWPEKWAAAKKGAP